MTLVAVPSAALLGAVAREDAEKCVRGCARPVRLVGSTVRISRATGEVIDCYSSAQELDGVTWVRCGDRRAARASHAAGSTRATPGICSRPGWWGARVRRSR
jgi:hypothetical protein